MCTTGSSPRKRYVLWFAILALSVGLLVFVGYMVKKSMFTETPISNRKLLLKLLLFYLYL